MGKLVAFGENGIRERVDPISLATELALVYRERDARDSFRQRPHALNSHTSARQVRHAHARHPAAKTKYSAMYRYRGPRLAAEALGKLQQCLVEIELLRLRPAEG